MSSPDEAAAWFARARRGVMSLSERGAFERWMSDKGNRRALHELEELWTLTEGARRPSFYSRHIITALCTSLALVVLSFISSSAFWTGLDWANR